MLCLKNRNMKQLMLCFLLFSTVVIARTQIITQPFLNDSYNIRAVTDDCSSLLTQDFYQEVLIGESFVNKENDPVIFNIDIDQNILFNVTHGFLKIDEPFSREQCCGNIFILKKLIELKKSGANIHILGNCNFNANISQFENLSLTPGFEKVFDKQLIETVKLIASKKYRDLSEKSNLIDFVQRRFVELHTLPGVDLWDLFYAKTILGKVLFGNDYFNSEWQSFIIEKIHKHVSFTSYSNGSYNDFYDFFNMSNSSIFLNSCEVRIIGRKKVIKNNHCFNQLNNFIKLSKNIDFYIYDGRNKKYVNVTTGVEDYSYRKIVK